MCLCETLEEHGNCRYVCMTWGNMFLNKLHYNGTSIHLLICLVLAMMIVLWTNLLISLVY